LKGGRRAALAALLLALAGCDAGGRPPALARPDTPIDTVGLRSLPVPSEHAAGRQVFDARCTECHGEAALGSVRGPPLVHIYYEPNHHADMAFVLAISRGVRAHHWNFGDMPPVPGLSPQQVEQVIGYLRWLQRQAGVY
jgi:mono/diheme cytochrome c family protein